ncbi:MAG: FIST N-terminal domain-containing protein [Planctomycetota bacterium]|jgi:hypothetical protein
MMSELSVSVGQSNNGDSHSQLLAGVASAAGDIPMVGGTTAGEISTSGFSTESVVIMALSSDTLDFVTGIGQDMSGHEKACGAALVDDIGNKTSLKRYMESIENGLTAGNHVWLTISDRQKA